MRQLTEMPPVIAALAAEMLQLGFRVRWDTRFDPKHLDIEIDQHTNPRHELWIDQDKVTVTANDGCGHVIPTDFDLCDPEFLQRLRAYFDGYYYTSR